MPKKPKTAERYCDRRGIAYEDRHLLVPSRMDMWPKYPPRVKEDTEGVQAEFHAAFGRWQCWLCNQGPEWTPSGALLGGPLQLHHLCSGTKGRSHERELFVMACPTCHANRVTAADFGKWLALKWQHDHDYCDWELLTIRHGRHLPPLMDPEGNELTD